MSVDRLAATAAEMARKSIADKKTNKALQALPKQKQDKFRGIIMIVSGVMMVISGLRMLKKGDANLNYSGNAGLF
jgi:predicted negative regulator of RcsB-dependent stress response